MNCRHIIPVYRGKQRGHCKERAPHRSSPHEWPSPPSSFSPPAVSAGVPGKKETHIKTEVIFKNMLDTEVP